MISTVTSKSYKRKCNWILSTSGQVQRYQDFPEDYFPSFLWTLNSWQTTSCSVSSEIFAVWNKNKGFTCLESQIKLGHCRNTKTALHFCSRHTNLTYSINWGLLPLQIKKRHFKRNHLTASNPLYLWMNFTIGALRKFNQVGEFETSIDY